ncbi:MAG: ABC transporter permease [Thermodesulfovibrionales bacterium]
MVSIDAIGAIARKELTDRLRTRWVIVIATAFSVFTILIAYFGSAPSGIAGFRRIEATVASLTSLVTYFIPILALTLGGGIIIDERERGTLDLFLSAPISFSEFIAGKFSGLLISLTISTLGGLGLAGLILILKAGFAASKSYIFFMFNSIILGLIFLSLSFLISVLFEERSKVIAFMIFIWLSLSVLYDLALLGLLILTKGELSSAIFTTLLLLNPVDIYRVMNFLSIGEFKVFIGLASVEFPAFFKTSILLLISLLWIIVPLAASHYLFKRRYLT